MHFHSTFNTMKAWAEIGDLFFLVSAMASCTSPEKSSQGE
jgi:hypothetical protein